MKTYARIENGVVAELFETDGDIAEMFHPSMVWIEAPANVAVGYSYSAGSFTPPAAPAPMAHVPQSVSPLQARRALLAAGLLSQVQTAVAGADQETQLAWEFATSVDRDSAVVASLAAALGLSPAQLDALFTSAAAIVS
jgi:hypothetical protein